MNSIDFLIDQGFVSVHQWVERGVDTLRRAWSFETGWFEAFFIEKQLQAFEVLQAFETEFVTKKNYKKTAKLIFLLLNNLVNL